jgi:thiamine pyrophosphokinase
LRRDPDEDSTDLDKALAWIMRAEAAVKRRVRRKMKQQQQQELLQQQQPREAQATSIAVAAGSATDVPASAQIVAPVPVSAAAVAAAAALAALSPSPPPATPSPAGIEQWGPACCVDAAATCAAADVADANGSFVDCATHGGGGQSSSSSNHLASSLSPSAYAFFSSSSVSLRSLPVLLYPSFGGRFDQQTAILNALARHAHALPHAVMLSEGNLARVLMPTTPAAIPAAADPAAAAATAAAAPAVAPVVPLHHRLLVHPCLEQGHHCGLFPLSSPASRVSTSGLQWNLSDQSLAWGPGGLLSTSNRILRGEEVVTVRTDAALVWTSEIKHAKRTRTQQQQQQQQPPQPLQQ